MAVTINTKAACEAMGVSRATYYRKLKPKGKPGPRPKSKRALSKKERQEVLAVCHSEEFIDRPPATITATLADRGVYLCSTRTMYRVLDDAQEIKERRSHPAICRQRIHHVAKHRIVDAVPHEANHVAAEQLGHES